MIKHIVMWKLKAEAAGATKEDNARKLKVDLEALQAMIPEIKRIEVGLNFADSEQAADVVLYSEFDDVAALAVYQDHPEHQKVVAFVREIVSERRVADYVS